MTHRLATGPICQRIISPATRPREWIPLRPPEFYDQHDIKLRLGTRVVAIHIKAREIELADGSRHGYGALLLATGAEPSGSAFPAAICRTSTICGRSRTAGR